MRRLTNTLVVLGCLCLVASCNWFSASDTARDEQAVSSPDGSSTTGGATTIEEDENKIEDIADETPDRESEAAERVTTVSFGRGNTSRTYRASLGKGDSHSYKVAASKGQNLELKFSSDKSNAAFTVLDPKGKPLASESETSIYKATLPTDGTYSILVRSESGADAISLDIAIPVNEENPVVPAEPEGITKTVRFAKGATSASYEDAVVRGTRNRYVLGAKAGNVMNVRVSSVEDNAVFQIRGPKGYLPGAEPGTDRKTWSGKLPVDGNYTVIVGPTRGNATYSVRFEIK